MPRTKEQFEAMKESTNQKIRLSAVKIFVQKGFIATTIQEIANDAQISIGLIYRHYKSKEDLFWSLLQDGNTEQQDFLELFSSDLPPVDIVKTLIKNTIRDLEVGDAFSRQIVALAHLFIIRREFALLNSTEWVQNMLDVNSKIVDLMCEVIERGQLAGDFKEGDPMQMAMFYFSMINGLYTMQLMSLMITEGGTIEFPLLPIPTEDMILAFLLKEKLE